MPFARSVAPSIPSGGWMCLVVLLCTSMATVGSVPILDRSNGTEIETVSTLNGTASSKATTLKPDATDVDSGKVAIWIWILMAVATVVSLLVVMSAFFYWYGMDEQDSSQEQVEIGDNRPRRKEKPSGQDKVLATGTPTVASSPSTPTFVMLTKSRIASGMTRLKREVVQAGKATRNKLKLVFVANKSAKMAMKKERQLKRQLKQLKKLTPVDASSGPASPPVTTSAPTSSPTPVSPPKVDSRNGGPTSPTSTLSPPSMTTDKAGAQEGTATVPETGGATGPKNRESDPDAHSDESRVKKNVAMYKKK